MNSFEKSAIIGYYRNGVAFELIGFLMGISAKYAEDIVNEYLKKKSL